MSIHRTASLEQEKLNQANQSKLTIGVPSSNLISMHATKYLENLWLLPSRADKQFYRK